MIIFGLNLSAGDLWLLGTCGALIIALVGYHFLLDVQRHNAFNSAAEDFRNTLIPSINKLDGGKFKFDVIKSDFPSHREAMLRFVQHIKGKARCSFEKDWKEYENWYQDVCCRGTEGILFPDEGEVEFSKKRAINPSMFLNRLLIHAAPK
jgi:hypothetical protein